MKVDGGVLIPEYEEIYQQCLDFLSENYDVSRIVRTDFEKISAFLDDFYLFKPYKMNQLVDAYFVKHISERALYCVVATDRDEESAAEGEGEVLLTDPYQFFLIDLRTDMGKVLIRPETIGDKIFEALIEQEVDFDIHPEFSRKYYLYTDPENQPRVRRKMNRDFLDVIYRYDELVIQIVKNFMMVKRLQRINREDCEELAEFIFAVPRMLGKEEG